MPHPDCERSGGRTVRLDRDPHRRHTPHTDPRRRRTGRERRHHDRRIRPRDPAAFRQRRRHQPLAVQPRRILVLGARQRGCRTARASRSTSKRPTSTVPAATTPAIVAAFDADGDGTVSESELAIDTDEKQAVVASRLESLSLSDPHIVGEVQAYSVAHGVVGGDWAIRDCQVCHSSNSRLSAGMRLGTYVPGGVLPDVRRRHQHRVNRGHDNRRRRVAGLPARDHVRRDRGARQRHRRLVRLGRTRCRCSSFSSASSSTASSDTALDAAGTAGQP